MLSGETYSLPLIINFLLLIPLWMGNKFSRSSTPRKEKGDKKPKRPGESDRISRRSSKSSIDKRKFTTKTSRSTSSHDSKGRNRTASTDPEDVSLEQVDATPDSNLVEVELLISKLRQNDPSLESIVLQKYDLFTRLDSEKNSELILDLCESLRQNKYLKKLSITESGLNDDFAISLSGALAENTSISILDLRGNEITSIGLQHLAIMLKTNISLKELYISNQKDGFTEEDEEKLLAGLDSNSSLTYIDLEFSDPAVKTWAKKRFDSNSRPSQTYVPEETSFVLTPVRLTIMAIFSHNYESHELNLHNNDEFKSFSLQDKVSVAFCINVNPIIEALDLSYTTIDDSFIEELSKHLKINNSLKYLNLSFNNIGSTGIIMIAEAIKENKCLKELKVSGQSQKLNLEAEVKIADSLMNNPILLNLEIDLQDPTCIERIGQYLSRNSSRQG